MHEHTTIPFPQQQCLTEAPGTEVIRQEVLLQTCKKAIFGGYKPLKYCHTIFGKCLDNRFLQPYHTRYTPSVATRSPAATLANVVMRMNVPAHGARMVSCSSPYTL